MNKITQRVLVLAVSILSCTTTLAATPILPAQELIYPLNGDANKIHIFVLLLCWFFWALMLIWLMRGLKQWRSSNTASKPAGTVAFVSIPVVLGAALLTISSWVVYRWQQPIDPQLSINILAYHGPDKYDYTWKTNNSPIVHQVYNAAIYVKQNTLTYIDTSTELQNKSNYRKTLAKMHTLFPEFAHIAKITPTKTGTFAIDCKYNCSVSDDNTPIHVTVYSAKQFGILGPVA